MWGNREIESITATFNGEPIGELKSISIENEPLRVSGGNKPISFTRSFTLTNVKWDDQDHFRNQLLGEQMPAFDIIISKKGMPKSRQRMTKNRRIQKKWLKKYGPPYKVKYYDCTIEEAGNDAIISYTK
jgi:hypothetical protein